MNLKLKIILKIKNIIFYESLKINVAFFNLKMMFILRHFFKLTYP